MSGEIIGVIATIVIAIFTGGWWIQRQFNQINVNNIESFNSLEKKITTIVNDYERKFHYEIDRIEKKQTACEGYRQEVINDMTKKNDDYHLQLHLRQEEMDKRIELNERNFNEVKAELKEINKMMVNIQKSFENYKAVTSEYIAALISNQFKELRKEILKEKSNGK